MLNKNEIREMISFRKKSSLESKIVLSGEAFAKNDTLVKTGKLILEDGTEFSGFSFGQEGNTNGEVVFNNGMTMFSTFCVTSINNLS